MLPPPPPAPMARPVPIIRSPIDSCSPEMGVNSSPSPPPGRQLGADGSDNSSVASVVVHHVRDDHSADLRVSSPQTSVALNTDPMGGPVNRSVMNSPFGSLGRHEFPHVSHHSVLQETRPDHSESDHFFRQLFSYGSMGQVSGMSGVISPTNLTMFTTPVSTSRPTSRTAGIPRWNTTSATYIPLDENLDYGMMSGLMPSNQDVDSPQIIGAEGIPT